MDNRALVRKGRTKLLLSLVSLGGIFVAEIIAVTFVVFSDVSYESLWSDIIVETAGAIAAMIAVVLLGGKAIASVSRDDVAYTFRFGWWCLAISFAMVAMELWTNFSEGVVIVDDWYVRVVETAILCLGIGICEEFMFRGVIFNGLLAAMGATHKGVVRAILLTSLFFGFAHVDFSSDFVDGLSAIQAVLKILQTGMYSFMLCVIVLRTHRLGGASLFHAFDDFVLVVPSVALYGETLDTEYVTQGDEAVSAILYYLLVIALYVPFVIKSIRELRRGQDVTLGAFMEGEVARLQVASAEGVPVSVATPVAPMVPDAAGSVPATYAVPPAAAAAPQAEVPTQPEEWGVPVPTTEQTRADYRPLETLAVPQAPVAPAAPSAPEAPSHLGGQSRAGRPPVPKGL